MVPIHGQLYIVLPATVDMSDVSEDFDLFDTAILEGATWRTIEDQDLLIAQTIAEHLRRSPLVPAGASEVYRAIQWEIDRSSTWHEQVSKARR